MISTGWGLLLLSLVVTTGGPAVALERGPHRVGVIRDARIPESSALAYSTQHPGMVYTINDSGHDATVFTVEVASGRVRGTTTLAGVDATDTEALAIGPDDRLYVGDIGDNEGNREATALYALAQPGRTDSMVRPTTYPVRYSDGPHDAEALVAVPGTSRLAIVTKGLFSGAVYLLPSDLSPDGANVAKQVAGVTVPGLVTDAGVLSERRAVLLRTYTDAVVYRMPEWRRVAIIPLPRQRQGESLAVHGSTLLVGTEGLPSPLIELPLPRSVRERLRFPPASARTPSPTPSPTADLTTGAGSGANESDLDWPAWAVGVSTLVLGGAWLFLRRSQRNRSTT
ncbi:hypothetical protein BH18ACT8_BH18ACT8_02220 [soil metagenome]